MRYVQFDLGGYFSGYEGDEKVPFGPAKVPPHLASPENVKGISKRIIFPLTCSFIKIY